MTRQPGLGLSSGRTSTWSWREWRRNVLSRLFGAAGLEVLLGGHGWLAAGLGSGAELHHRHDDEDSCRLMK